jgi:uncharacterized membrane protein YcfT
MFRKVNQLPSAALHQSLHRFRFRIFTYEVRSYSFWNVCFMGRFLFPAQQQPAGLCPRASVAGLRVSLFLWRDIVRSPAGSWLDHYRLFFYTVSIASGCGLKRQYRSYVPYIEICRSKRLRRSHETDVSAQQGETQPKIRLPGPDEDPGGAAGFKAPPG